MSLLKIFILACAMALAFATNSPNIALKLPPALLTPPRGRPAKIDGLLLTTLQKRQQRCGVPEICFTGSCCQPGDRCCPPADECCKSTEQCLGTNRTIGCCLQTDTICPGNTFCCHSGTTCCGDGCCPAGTTCCEGGCCPAGSICQFGGCVDKSTTVTRTTTRTGPSATKTVTSISGGSSQTTFPLLGMACAMMFCILN